MIPKKAFDDRIRKERERTQAVEAAVASLQQENQQLRAHYAALQQQAAQPPKQPERILTRAELQEAVEQEKITQAQADAYLAAVTERKSESRLNERIAQERQQIERDFALDRQIQGYVQRFPKLGQQGSEELRKVHGKVQELVNRGLPNDLNTQVIALETIYGALSDVEDTTRDNRETDAPGGDGGGPEEPGAGPKLPAGVKLTNEERQGYERLIAKGRYEGWEDPVLQKELSYLQGR